MDKIIGIYKITNKVNGKVYIGESNNIYKRWQEHIDELNNNKHHSHKLQSDWNKYGEENFTFEILEELQKLDKAYKTTMQLIYIEDKYIKQYNALTLGYNVEYTVKEILNGNKVIMSKKIDAKYLSNLIKNNGVVKESKQKKEKEVKEVKIQKPVIVYQSNKNKINGIRTCMSVVGEFIEEGYIIEFSKSKLYYILASKNILKHENNSFYINDLLNNDYFINGKESTNKQGYKYNQIIITDKGKEFIIDLLKLKKS